jgi:hypothetical protein
MTRTSDRSTLILNPVVPVLDNRDETNGTVKALVSQIESMAITSRTDDGDMVDSKIGIIMVE